MKNEIAMKLSNEIYMPKNLQYYGPRIKNINADSKISQIGLCLAEKGHLWYRDLPGPTRRAKEYSELLNINADSYLACLILKEISRKMLSLALGPANLPGPIQQDDAYLKSSNIGADTYSACYDMPAIQI